MSLLISSHPWTNIILNFVIGLAISNNYYLILMILNYLMKKKY